MRGFVFSECSSLAAGLNSSPAPASKAASPTTAPLQSSATASFFSAPRRRSAASGNKGGRTLRVRRSAAQRVSARPPGAFFPRELFREKRTMPIVTPMGECHSFLRFRKARRFLIPSAVISESAGSYLLCLMAPPSPWPRPSSRRWACPCPRSAGGSRAAQAGRARAGGGCLHGGASWRSPAPPSRHRHAVFR